jgi:hypothetical protein
MTRALPFEPLTANDVRHLATEIHDRVMPETAVAELYRLTDAVLLLTQVVVELPGWLERSRPRREFIP